MAEWEICPHIGDSCTDSRPSRPTANNTPYHEHPVTRTVFERTPTGWKPRKEEKCHFCEHPSECVCSPKQREERESPEWVFLWDVIRAGCHTHHAVAGDIDRCAKCDHNIRHPIHSPARVFEILQALRTHSPSSHTYDDGSCIRCGQDEECRPVEARTVWRREDERERDEFGPVTDEELAGAKVMLPRSTSPVHDGHCTTCGAPAEIVEGEEGTVSVVRASEEPVGRIREIVTEYGEGNIAATAALSMISGAIGQPLDGEGSDG